MKNNKTERNMGIDVLRIFCCFCIIVLHESGLIINHHMEWLSFQVIVRPALFAFAAISGYFLLNNCDISNAKKFYIKRLSTLIIPLFIYCVLIKLVGNKMDGFRFIYGINKDFFFSIVTGNYSAHLWFVYSMISLYIVTPYLKIIVDKLSDKQLFRFLLLIFFFISINPVLKYYGYNIGLSIMFAGEMTFYYILGYYLSKINFTNKYIIIITIIQIISILSIMFYLNDKLFIQTTLWTSSINMIIGVVFYFAIFGLIKKVPSAIAKIITFISARTYGIYIVHFFILQRLLSSGILKYSNSNIMYMVLFKCFIIFVIALAVTIVVDLIIINPLKKMINKFLV